RTTGSATGNSPGSSQESPRLWVWSAADCSRSYSHKSEADHMGWYPGAIRKKITAKNRSRMTWYRRVNLHVAVSEASSLFSYFNQKGIPDSHFYVRKDGTIEQMVDTAYQAYADLQGND